MFKKMKVLLAGIVLIILATGCGKDNRLCRANMHTIAVQQVLYYAQNERYTASMGELGLENVTCPDGGSYRLNVEGEHLSIECPNGHGSIDDGISSWQQ